MNEFTLIGTIEELLEPGITMAGIKVQPFLLRVERLCKTTAQKNDVFKVTAFKELAEEVTATKHSGDKVMIHGRLQDNNYQKNDVTYFSNELVAYTVLKIAE